MNVTEAKSLTEKMFNYVNSSSSFHCEMPNATALKITGATFIGSVMYYPTSNKAVINSDETAQLFGDKTVVIPLKELLSKLVGAI